MSTYRGHIAGGVVAYAITATMVNAIGARAWSWSLHALFIVCTLFGALFPDIDTRSTIQMLFFIVMIPVLPLSLLYYTPLFLCLSALCLAVLFIPHRTLTHRPWFMIAISAIIAGIILAKAHHHRLLLSMCCAYFCAGALSHWFLDFGVRRIFPKK